MSYNLYLFQKLSDKDVVLKCLYDFDGEEDDELTITEGQVSNCKILSSGFIKMIAKTCRIAFASERFSGPV